MDFSATMRSFESVLLGPLLIDCSDLKTLVQYELNFTRTNDCTIKECLMKLMSSALLLTLLSGTVVVADVDVQPGPYGEIILDPTMTPSLADDGYVYDTFMGGGPNLEYLVGTVGSVRIANSDNEFEGSAVTFGDFNGDGAMDLVVASEWARDKLNPRSTNLMSRAGAGKIYILYGDPSVHTPFDLSLRRNGSPSDHQGNSLSLHEDFVEGGMPTFIDTWFNLFDIDGALRVDTDNENGDLEFNRISGAVLYGVMGAADATGTSLDGEGNTITHVVDFVNGMTESVPALDAIYSVEPGYDEDVRPEDIYSGTGTMPESSGALTGFAVSNAGDVNGDGIDDLLIGAPGYSYDGHEPIAEDIGIDPPGLGEMPHSVVAYENDTGCVYLIFGSPVKLSGEYELEDVGNGAQGIPGVQFIGSSIHTKLGQ
ncbi:MAG: FG-GAP repeat protein, partial [Phycisphaerales bacterium]|nr:FG-GAP repeat protein [Phycisphaerales bacterium]